MEPMRDTARRNLAQSPIQSNQPLEDNSVAGDRFEMNSLQDNGVDQQSQALDHSIQAIENHRNPSLTSVTQPSLRAAQGSQSNLQQLMQTEENADQPETTKTNHPVPPPNISALKNYIGPYIESLAKVNNHSISGMEHIPLNKAFILLMSHSVNTREMPIIVKRIHDHLEEKGKPGKLARVLVDRKLMFWPLNRLFGGVFGCMEASPENFKALREAGEIIGLSPEGMRGSLTRLDTVNWRGRGLAQMAMKYNIAVLPTASAGVEALHRDVSDLFGPLKPLLQRPLDFIKELGYEQLSAPILLGLVTPAGPFPAYLVPKLGNSFADHIHTQVGSLLEPARFMEAFNQANGTTMSPEDVAKIYGQQLKTLISQCYRCLRGSGAYFNDNTERFAQLLDRISRAPEQPSFNEIFNQLPTPLHETLTEEKKSLAAALSDTLSNPQHRKAFQAFQAIEQFNDSVLKIMNLLVRQAHNQVQKNRNTPFEVKRRLKENTKNLLISPLLWLISYGIHKFIFDQLKLSPKINMAVHGLYLMTVGAELVKDGRQILSSSKSPRKTLIKSDKTPEREKFEDTHNKLE